MLGRFLLFAAVFLGALGGGILVLLARDNLTEGRSVGAPGTRSVTLAVSGMW
jgi:hypothetical protein